MTTWCGWSQVRTWEWQPLEFQFPDSGDDYPDLSYCHLYLKCQVLKTDVAHWSHQEWQQRGTGGLSETHEPAVPLPVQTSGPGNEQHHDGFEQEHLPIEGLPDRATQPWSPGQNTCYCAWKVEPRIRQASTICRRTGPWSSIRRWPRTLKPLTSRATGTQTCCLQEWLVKTCEHKSGVVMESVGVPSHGLWRQAQLAVAHRGGHPGDTQSQDGSL